MGIDDTAKLAESLCRADITKLTIDRVFRRGLVNAGYRTLGAAFEADQRELDRALDYRLVDEVFYLKDLLKNDPSSFVEKVNAITLPAERSSEQAPAHQAPTAECSWEGRSRSAEQSQTSKGIVFLPNSPEIEQLKELEKEACTAVRLLEDTPGSILADTFGPLGSKIEEIDNCFSVLFDRYRTHPQKVLDVAEAYYPKAFLVFVADLARKEHDGEALWKNVFNDLGFPANGNAQANFKKLFYGILECGNFTRYTREEHDNFYLYTALLHGGFSESFWSALWAGTILPLARKTGVSYVTDNDALQILDSACNRLDSRADASMFVIKILNKAPKRTVIPLFKAALTVGQKAVKLEDGGEVVKMLSGAGLPDTALVALKKTLSQGNNEKLFYLPQAELRLAPADGVVLLHWDEQRFPLDFAAYSIRYCVNCQDEVACEFSQDFNRLTLRECTIEVSPCTRFDAEVFLIEKKTGKIISQTCQSFDRTRPGTFEFILGGDGIFRLRKASSRLNSTRTIAYLTKEELRVIPRFGMTECGEFDGYGDWQGASIQLFEVEPGSAGSLLNLDTNTIIASWQENYHVNIDRHNGIGKGQNDCDLFGFILSDSGTNAALPIITIEAQEMHEIKDDIEISCVCDGENISLQRKVSEPDLEIDPLGQVGLCIDMTETNRINRAVSEGQLEIKQRSSGNTILFYRFATVPIQSFKILKLKTDQGVCKATYELSVIDDVAIKDDGYHLELNKGDAYKFDARLKDDRHEMVLFRGSDSLGIPISLSLAAMDLCFSSTFAKAAQRREITLNDCGDLDGRATIICSGRRNTREAYVKVGDKFVFFKKLSGNGSYRFDLLADKAPFRSANRQGEPFKMIICLNYGFDGREEYCNRNPVELEIARCIADQGLGVLSMVVRQEGAGLSFSRPPKNGYRISFADRRGRELGSIDVEEEQRFALFPHEVAYRLRTKKEVSATIMPLSLFGDGMEDEAITVKLG